MPSPSRTALVRSRNSSLPSLFTNAETLGACYSWGYPWSQFYRGNLHPIVRRMSRRGNGGKRKRTRKSPHKGRGHRFKSRSRGLRLDPRILGCKEVVAEVGRGGQHLESKRTTCSIDYTIHLRRAVGTLNFKGGNLCAGREIPKGGTRFTF